jgi:DNA damage-inducible protein 1
MLVDTGAQTSVLSMPLVRQLGLSFDRSLMGVAAGVGRARICGRVTNVVCSLGTGHVEFLMDFIVLDVSDQLVIIGLDQLRKYKCLVDMERELLIFGGAGGVEVQMLPAEHQHFDARSWNNSGCILM